MTHSAWLAIGLIAVSTAGASVQVKPSRRVALLQYLQISHTGVTRDLLAAAELMPAGDYEFKPSTMPAARTFGGVIAHACALDEAGAAGYIAQGPAEVPRSAALAGLLAHDAEMFGISTVYLRAKNLVPPGSK